MIQRLSRPGLAVALLLVGWSAAFAQQDLDLINKPKTVPEFWRAVKFEISQGKYDLAADFLKGLLALNPTDKDLLAIEDREGVASFLALRNVQKWSDNPKTQAEARQNVETIIARVTDAVKKLRTDPERIAKFVKNLSASPEEREYAIVELRKSGTAIMPTFVAALIAADLEERVQLLSVIPLLDADTVPAVLATMDVPNAAIRLDLMGAIARRSDLLKLLGRTETDPRPTLWYFAAKQDLVGQRAREMLAILTRTDASRLPAPRGELLKAADVAYQHKTTFSNGTDAPPVWRWTGNKLVSAKLSVSLAEEHYGLRYSRWALELDPNDQAAQVEFLSIATEKALERVGFEKRLSVAAPAVYEMLSLAPAGVLYTMVDRAVSENHIAVAIGACQVIGDRAEAKGYKGQPAPTQRNMEAIRTAPDPLVRALNSKDRRLALAAADALTRVPGTPGEQVAARIVEVYRSLLANPADVQGINEPHPKALIADADRDRADIVSGVLRAAGFDTVVTNTGRDTLKRLNLASDIDVLWINHELPYPELPYLLAQVRSDVKYGGLPIFITLSEDITKALLPELDVRIDHLIRDNQAIKVVERSPVRIVLGYDGARVKASDLVEWLRMLRIEKPTVRADIEATLVIRVHIDKTRESDPELKQRLAELAVDLPEVKVTPESANLLIITLDATRPTPEDLENRLARLERDFNKSVTIVRELPTRVTLTSNMTTKVPLHVEGMVKRAAEPYQRILVVQRPVTAEDVRQDMLAFVEDPSARPLTATERKEYQLRAMEGLRRLATGVVPGYDVRPAAQAIRSALHNDDLAALAIDTVVRLPGKEAQQDLADLVLNANRPAALRVKAAAGLLQHMQLHTAVLLDAQIQGLLRVFDSDPNPEVRSAVAPVLGALPRDRVLRNLPDQATRDSWLSRIRKYDPGLEQAAPPAPAPKPDEK
ncbi:MAG: hypothetical protein ACJ8F7_13760 [Gemmataceae bacterium]